MEITMRSIVALAVALTLLAGSAVAVAEEDPLTVTAKLVKIPGKFPPDELYDYAYVMRYEVTTGKLSGKSLLVAHYKPRRARSEIKDKMKKHVGGTLRAFKEGDLHQLTLTAQLKKIWKGALVDEFFATDRKSPRYWCLKADAAKK
jgi:hypothetical protein